MPSAPSRASDNRGLPFIFGVDEPRPYQLDGIYALREHRRWGLWDDPGLGKSLQAAYASVRPVVLDVPGELAEQWMNYWLYLFPNDRVQLCTAKKWDRLERSRRMITPADVYIISTEMTRYEKECNRKCGVWRETGKCKHPKVGIRDYIAGKRVLRFQYPLPVGATLIIDEAHVYRGHKSDMAKGLVEYAKTFPFVFELTGTPIYKTNDDCYMQLRVLWPLLFNDYTKFMDTWCEVDTSEFKTRIVGSRFSGQFAKVLTRYGMRRTYADVGRALPKEIRNPPIVVELTESEQRRYDSLVDDYTEIIEDGSAKPIFAAGAIGPKLARITMNDSKLEALRARVETLRYRMDGTERGVVIFVWHRYAAHKAADMWPEAVCITGEIAEPAERVRLAKSSSLIVATMASLSVGVDLSHCHVVQYLENDYVPGRQFGQALKRVLRERVNNPDDDEPVIVDFYHCPDTIDTVKYASVTEREMSEEEIMDRVVEQTKLRRKER